jgi:threonine dehydratase
VFGEAGHAETGGKRLSLRRIEEAARCIDPVFLGSRQYEAEVLSDELELRLVCKVETANPIRTFQGRGTDYFMHRIGGEEGWLVCASAGNFGQWLAYAARKRNLPLTVFAAESANPAKVERMRRLGAEVRLDGADFDEAKAAARVLAESEGWRFVEDGRESEIAEGTGTIALEMCRWPEPFDAVLVPLGGTWMKDRAPSTEVIGVCAEGAPAMALSLREGVTRTTERVDTIADSIAVHVLVEEALSDLSGVVDDVLLVDDGTMVGAMRLLFWKMGLVVEPAGAAGIAAPLAHREHFAGALVATPLYGSNHAGGCWRTLPAVKKEGSSVRRLELAGARGPAVRTSNVARGGRTGRRSRFGGGGRSCRRSQGHPGPLAKNYQLRRGHRRPAGRGQKACRLPEPW